LRGGLYLGMEANSTPCFGNDGAIYVGSERHLNAVNPNGTFRWRFSTFYPVHGSIGISGSRIFFGAWDNAFRAVNLSGVQQWMAPLNSPMESGVAFTADRVYFTYNLNELRAYSHTGALQWRHSGYLPRQHARCRFRWRRLRRRAAGQCRVRREPRQRSGALVNEHRYGELVRLARDWRRRHGLCG
jgi:hypothetical protein